MASVIDIGLLDYFVPVFVFLLIFGIVFALLEKVKLFGTNKGLNSLISFAIACLFILTPELMKVIKIMTPWFTILFVFVIMIVLLFMFVGIKEESISVAFQDRSLIWIIIILSLTIFAYALTQVYGSQVQTVYAGENVTSEQGNLMGQVGKIVFHPRVLGMVILLLIAAQAVRMITASISGK